VTPTLATRAIGLQCLQTLLESLVKSLPPASASAILQVHAQTIVRCAFVVIEDSVETLKAGALEILCLLLDAASALAERGEPEASAAMDVYAAPYVTALKTCLASSAPVATATEAARLAGKVLSSGMLQGDLHSMQVHGRALYVAWFVT
jgi:hypothetical protein